MTITTVISFVLTTLSMFIVYHMLEYANQNKVLKFVSQCKKKKNVYHLNSVHIVSDTVNFRSLLMELWFKMYPRSSSNVIFDSSGFEHAMVGELKGTSTVSGFHSWIQFYLQEKAGHLSFQSQMKVVEDAGPSVRSNNGFLIPSLLQSNISEYIFSTYWQYVNTIQALCKNQTRIGSLWDGGKEVCIDEMYKPGPQCLVYSFGSNFQFDFEEDVIQKFGCEVHTFDPSQPITNSTKRKIPKNVTFHLVGLGDKDTVTNQKWEMRTLLTLMKQLKHQNRTIDILKIDIEHGEWKSFPQMISSGVLKRVKQICVEIHFDGHQWKLHVLRELYDAGFRIVMRDRNLSCPKDIKGLGKIVFCMELLLVNVEWLHN